MEKAALPISKWRLVSKKHWCWCGKTRLCLCVLSSSDALIAISLASCLNSGRKQRERCYSPSSTSCWQLDGELANWQIYGVPCIKEIASGSVMTSRIASHMWRERWNSWNSGKILSFLNYERTSPQNIKTEPHILNNLLFFNNSYPCIP